MTLMEIARRSYRQHRNTPDSTVPARPERTVAATPPITPNPTDLTSLSTLNSRPPSGSREADGGGVKAGQETPFTLVTDPAGLAGVEVVLRDAIWAGVDLETTGLNPRTDRVRLLSLHTTAGTFVIDCFAVNPSPLFEALSAVELIGHNLAFDLGFLVALGFTPGATFDSLLASQALHAGEGFRHGLKDAAERHLGKTVDKAEQRSDWSGSLTPDQLAYAAKDAELPVRLSRVLATKLVAEKLVPVNDLENRALPAIAWMASKGVSFDRERWSAMAAEAEVEVRRLTEELNDLAPNGQNLFGTDGRNWNSPEQVRAAFASQGVLLDSTDDDALAAVDHPLAETLRNYRGMVKRAGTYGQKWLRHVSADGRVYPAWRQIGAGASGRMSCAAPNVQQLPRDVRYRKCFVAPPGRVLVKADYSQIELRLAAKIAREPVMQAAYRDGKDLHSETARAILGKTEVTKADRQLAKAVNFGLLYGMGSKAFAVYAKSNYGVSLTPAQANEYRNAFFRTYPGLRVWHRTAGVSDRAVDTRTVLGRRRKGVERYTEKLNSPVQGSGADGLKQALALLWERRHEYPGAFPVLAVHDEIVAECDAAETESVTEWLKRCMIDGMAPFADPVPVEVEATVGTTWGGDA